MRVEVGLDRVGDLVQQLAAAPRGRRATTRRTRPPAASTAASTSAASLSRDLGEHLAGGRVQDVVGAPRRGRRTQLPPMKFWSGMDAAPSAPDGVRPRCCAARRRPAQGIPLRLCFKVTESVAKSCIARVHLRASSRHRGEAPRADARAADPTGGRSADGEPGAEHDVVISIDHVTKRFGAFVAVDDAHFDIRRGEFFSMLGPSGCGKTTTLRMIAGFEQPSEGADPARGQRRLEGPAVQAQRQHRLPAVRAVPAHDGAGQRRVRAARPRRSPRPRSTKRVGELLEIVRLGDFAHRKPAQLSGGQQQRVALARALVNYPSALLLDEPLGALDLKLRQAMQLELKRIQREVGITFIFVTHDQEEALTMSDRIAVMSEGRVEQIGSPEEIYHQPETVFVAGFIGMANLLPADDRAVTRASSRSRGSPATAIVRAPAVDGPRRRRRRRR